MFDFKLIEDSEVKGRSVALEFGGRDEDVHGYYHIHTFVMEIDRVGDIVFVTGPAMYASINQYGKRDDLESHKQRVGSYILFKGELQ